MSISPNLVLSGERFLVTYRINAPPDEAEPIARELCLEQTVELPEALVPAGVIREAIVGRIEDLTGRPDGASNALVSFAIECVGDELPQLLNVVFGNTSLKPGIGVESLALPDALLAAFSGPRFGADGLRQRVRAWNRPLLCTALKPMGLPTQALAHLAHQCALSGLDIIKDNHGLTNQTFAPFYKRVNRCAEAVKDANRLSGEFSLYAPNIAAPADEILVRARAAQEAGAGAVLLAPGLTGFDAVRQLAAAPDFDLPILMHPALLGGFVASPTSGIAHGAVLGTITRLAGADATIFPNCGGRFSFSRAEGEEIVVACHAPLGGMPTIMPTPAGGMTLGRVPELHAAYGNQHGAQPARIAKPASGCPPRCSTSTRHTIG